MKYLTVAEVAKNWGLTPRKEIAQVPITNGPKLCQPFDLRKLRLVKNIALTKEAEHGSSLVHQEIFCSHADASL